MRTLTTAGASTGTASIEARRAKARVPLDESRTLFGRMMTWYSRRAYGDVLDTGLALLHNRRVLGAVLGFERKVAKWDALDDELKVLAEIACAGAMTATPPEVTDEISQALRADLGAAAFVELTMMVAVENQRSRFNSALGLTSQGFSDRCQLQPPHEAARFARASAGAPG